jgi:dTDP-4-amino-4,6-dideoxygalactose transaminase
MLRDHWQSRKYIHEAIGWNARMDGIHGAVLSVKLRYLEEWNSARRALASEYGRLLARVQRMTLPTAAPYGTHVYHIYAVRTPDRDSLLRDLGVRGIHCGIHYPRPIHLQAAYRSLQLARGSFPVAERCADEFLSLPIYPEMTTQAVRFVCERQTEPIAAAARG